MQTKISSDWFKTTQSAEERAKIKELVLSSGPVLELLTDILFRRLEAMPPPAERDYESPSWPFLAAHRAGRTQELEFLIKTLTLTDRE